MSGNGDFLADGRRLDDRSQFLRIPPHRVLLVFLKYSVEAERIDDALAGKPHDQSAVLRPLDVVGFQQMPEQCAEVLL